MLRILMFGYRECWVPEQIDREAKDCNTQLGFGMRYQEVLAVFVVGLAGATLSEPDHWLVVHIGKAAGTTFRSAVMEAAKEKGWSMQHAYSHSPKYFNNVTVMPVDYSKPAKVIMGHFVTNGIHRFLPKNATYRYATMFREPMQWMASLYFFLNGGPATSTKPDAFSSMMTWLHHQADDCPCILVDHHVPSKPCTSPFQYWLSPTHPGQCRGPVSCADIVRNWNHVDIVMITEHFDLSVDLFRTTLGLEPRGTNITYPLLNNRTSQYANVQTTLEDNLDFERFIDTTCFREIYNAALYRFDADVRQLSFPHNKI